jgi:hypothetical protein
VQIQHHDPSAGAASAFLLPAAGPGCEVSTPPPPTSDLSALPHWSMEGRDLPGGVPKHRPVFSTVPDRIQSMPLRAPPRSRRSALNTTLGAMGKQGGRLEGATNSTGGHHSALDRSTDVLYQESSAVIMMHWIDRQICCTNHASVHKLCKT